MRILGVKNSTAYSERMNELIAKGAIVKLYEGCNCCNINEQIHLVEEKSMRPLDSYTPDELYEYPDLKFVVIIRVSHSDTPETIDYKITIANDYLEKANIVNEYLSGLNNILDAYDKAISVVDEKYTETIEEYRKNSPFFSETFISNLFKEIKINPISDEEANDFMKNWETLNVISEPSSSMLLDEATKNKSKKKGRKSGDKKRKKQERRQTVEN